MEQQLKENVVSFINKCSKQVGLVTEDNFNQDMLNECQDLDMTSPIEHILYCAIRTLLKFNYFEEADVVEIGEKPYSVGLGIWPQKKIGNYRCDFEITYGSRVRRNGTQRIKKDIIVECDSQEFHERTEKERRYEKKRDRFLISKGYTAFHFTGSEIINTPYRVAAEIISHVTDQNIESIELPEDK